MYYDVPRVAKLRRGLWWYLAFNQSSSFQILRIRLWIVQTLVLSCPQRVGNPWVCGQGLEMFLEARLNLRKQKTTRPTLHNRAGKTCFILEGQPAIS